MTTVTIHAAIERAKIHAPFLRGQIEHHPDLMTLLEAGDVAGALARCDAALETEPPARRLRLERGRTALVLAIGDLAGILSLEQVTQRLSDLADRSLDLAIATAMRERMPDREPRGFGVVALGKHGGRELNYSSDIDPIFLYDPETLPHRAREEASEAAVRIGRRVIELLQARDADGYVFRVDLRLRPSPEVTPIVLPIDALIGYYESSAVAWERAAFVRARAAQAGDVGLARQFLDAISPFVWRRSLDFGAVGEMRAMSHRIRDHHGRNAFGPGYDLKRSRGGIREVEFYAQIHQLIHGGRAPQLRSPATGPALEALHEAGIVTGEDAAALANAYRLFRTIEHRLQMVDDRQTHQLPGDIDALDNVARLHGLSDGQALLDLLRPHVETVGRLYDALEGDAAPGLPVGEALLPALVAAGFDPPDMARGVIERWRGGGVRAVQSPAAREALEDVLPGLLFALGAAPDPDAALHRMDMIVVRLPSAINFFRLLAARPPLARLLSEILTHAPTLAEALGQRPELLDGLIDATAFEPAPALPDLVAALGHGAVDYERLLDHVRRAVGDRRFALGVQLIDGDADPLEVAGGYARVAEAALDVLTAGTVADHARQHGDVPGGELVVLALGRLGGGALTHASDLDLVYLFTGAIDAVSDGAKPLEATRYFNRLAQRVTAALSVPTSAGALYEVDTRLRPSGAKGLLAVTVESFANYQQGSAWTWEHMALTRARTVFGSPGARAAVQVAIDEVLARPRDPRALLRDVVEMRGEMARHKPPTGPLDAKMIPGGLVDLEFCIHAAQLEHRIGLDPRFPASIAALVDAGLLPPAFLDAHDILTRLLVMLRLVAPDGREPAPATCALIARACGHPDWNALLAAYARARQTVCDQWMRIVARSEED